MPVRPVVATPMPEAMRVVDGWMKIVQWSRTQPLRESPRELLRYCLPCSRTTGRRSVTKRRHAIGVEEEQIGNALRQAFSVARFVLRGIRIGQPGG